MCIIFLKANYIPVGIYTDYSFSTQIKQSVVIKQVYIYIYATQSSKYIHIQFIVSYLSISSNVKYNPNSDSLSPNT